MDGLFKDLVEAARTAGPFATVLMLYLYIRVDAERKALDKEIRDLLRASQGMTEALLRILGKSKGEE